ncbi:hypothetical protein X772_27825 [Mesorhizobium sp. LSJC280B00]|nr:hypothetical protein X772_27825 [Mesorhizobium sp. LSJC280B00]
MRHSGKGGHDIEVWQIDCLRCITGYHFYMGIMSKIALRSPGQFFVDLICNHAAFRTRQFSEDGGEIADTSTHLKDSLAGGDVQMVENQCPKRRQAAV